MSASLNVETVCGEALGEDPRRAEGERLGAPLPQGCPERPRRDRELGGPVQGPAQRRGEGGVGHRFRGGDVDRARQVAGEQVGHGRHPVADGDPGPPLATGGEASPDPELEGDGKPPEQPALGGEHDPGPAPQGADAGRGGRTGGLLPGGDELGEEPGAGRRSLGDGVVPGVTVEADCRLRQEHRRSKGPARHRRGEEGSRAQPALGHDLQPPSSETAVADAGAGQVHHGIDAIEHCRIDAAAGRVPRSLARRGRPPDEWHHLMPVGGEVAP